MRISRDCLLMTSGQVHSSGPLVNFPWSIVRPNWLLPGPIPLGKGPNARWVHLASGLNSSTLIVRPLAVRPHFVLKGRIAWVTLPGGHSPDITSDKILD